MNYFEKALEMHEQYRGKIEVVCTAPLDSKEDLSVAYTPGVAEPCREIHADIDNAYKYTAKGHLVAVVSDGSAVLGLGNIGATASIPVMEGKAVLFKRFGNIDAVPICLDTQDTDELVETVKRLAPCFGGINLEDIASPKCFEVERRLEEALDIPVFHDDQHGTAVVVTAGLINALKLANKNIEDVKIVLNGPGAAGTAIIYMLLEAGAKNIIACDEFGILYASREQGIEFHKKDLCAVTNLTDLRGDLSDALEGADVFIGVSVAGALKAEWIQKMNDKPIIFAMANPTPEIMYDEAKAAGVFVMGTGRSDFPNQINNVLAFPGIFKGALRARARDITPKMKVAAAYAIASVVSDAELNPEFIVPSIFEARVTEAVADAVEAAWNNR